MTCRSFRDPALDALYCDLDCVAHLFMCMARDLWFIKQTNTKERILSFCRVMTRADWRTLEKYANRVRILGVDAQMPGDRLIVDPNVLSAVQVHCGVALLPNLRELSASGEGGGDDPNSAVLLRDIVHFPRLFFAPSLKSLSIDDIELSLLHMLSVASQASPLLEHLSFTFWDKVGDEFLELLADAAGRLKKLVSLYLTFLEWETKLSTAHIVRMLNPLSSLEDLEIAWHNRDLDDDLPSIVPKSDPNSGIAPIPLQTLKRLFLRSSASEVYHTMKTLCDLSSLTSLHVDFGMLLEIDLDVPQAISAIAATLAASPIQTLNIQCFCTSSYPGSHPFEALRPLFILRNLKNLILGDCPHPALDNDMLGELARAFPNLRSLTLSWSRSSWMGEENGRRTNITFEGLSALLRHCSKLEKLTMAVDVTAEANSDVESNLRDTRQSKLATWVVHDSLISRSDVRYVARTLACLAPSLEKIKCYGDRGRAEIWREVEERLEDYIRVRALS